MRVLPFAIVIALVLGIFYYQSLEAEKRDRALASLEAQVAMLARALEESSVVSDKTRADLKELANRSTVVQNSEDGALTTAVARATPSVVSIVVKKDVPLLEVTYVNPFGNDPFFGDVGFRIPQYRQVGTEKKQVGAGSGFIVRADGYIVTNRHVVLDPAAEYVVLLSDGTQKQGTVVYRDEANDLAVLKIEGAGYRALPLSSTVPELGQTVAAIGNALGEYSNSVSVGIVSGLNRTIEAMDDSGRIETLTGVLQTDAAINPGNSGGPLINLRGEAVAVSVATNRGAQSISFAIPITKVKEMLAAVVP